MRPTIGDEQIKITEICVICGQKLEVTGKLSGTREKDAQDWGRGRPRPRERRSVRCAGSPDSSFKARAQR